MKKITSQESLLPKLLVLAVVLFFMILFSITLGSVSIDIGDTYRSLVNNIFGKTIFEVTWDASVDSIIYELRLPRLLLAAIGGGALAMAGVLMQTLTRNALADPYILGISSGASAGATCSIVMGSFAFAGSSNIATALGAFLGASLTSVLVFGLSGSAKNFSKTKLVLTGVAISSIFGALTTLIVTYAKNDSLVKNAIFWAAGSLSGASYNQIKIALVVLLIIFAICMYYGRDLDVFILGETMAKNMGVNTQHVVYGILIGTTLLTGTMVAFMGVVGFVGLLIPHIGRLFVGSAHRRLIPMSMFLGAILMVFTDTVGRTLIAPQEIPLGVITALLGGPFFLFLLRNNSYRFGGQ